MFESFPAGSPESLTREKYHEDFYRYFKSGIRFTNKLERGQDFKERGFASWEAFAAGDWRRALSLVEEKRDAYIQEFQEVSSRNITQRRLRVVEFPVTPYVQWELHVLRLRLELGESIKLIDARTLSDIEQTARVPEVVIVGDAVMYEVIYDGDGNAAGANRFTDQALIEETTDGFEALYGQGEDFLDFFDREISPLPPPASALKGVP